MASVIVEDPSENNNNKPSSSAFKQQRLPAWQPILTAGTVLPTFFIIGIAFIPIGFGLLMSSSKVKEVQIDYTHCKNGQGEECAKLIEENISKQCQCRLNFTIEKDIERDVFVYYGLTNYYQNHRRYVKSRDDKQLLGVKESLTEDCKPFQFQDPETKKNPIAPCGAIANSMFNDTINIRIRETEKGTKGRMSLIKLLRTGIAWATDKKSKFKNPGENGETLLEAFKGYTKPPYWRKPVWELDPSNPENNGYLYEPLIVWMRTSALPTFRKIYGRIDHSSLPDVKTSLPKGEYWLDIEYNYPVASFKGTKRVIISNTSWLGGKNPFLGVAYIIVGIICLVLSVVFFFIHRKFGKSVSEMTNVNQRTPYMSTS